MKLGILTLESSEMADIPSAALPFRWLAHHVQEIYLSVLPKVEINGSSKIALMFGHMGREVAFDNVLGVTSNFIEDFDFKRFYKLSSKEQELTLLAEIEKALLTIANRKGENQIISDIIKTTANEVMRIGFSLELQIKKLSKTSANRKHKVTVHRILNADVGEAWCCNITDKSAPQERKEWMTKVPDYLDRTDFFKKAEIIGNTYTVFNSFGKVVFQAEL
jgi:hypothetical protein